MTLEEVLERYPTQESFIKYLFNLHYPSPVKCPECKRIDRFYFDKINKTFKCACGHYVIFPRAHTIFDNSRIKFEKWARFFHQFAHGPLTREDIANIGISEPAARRMQMITMEMIYWHADITISPAEKEALRKEVRKFYGGISPKNEHLYITSFAFRNNFKEKAFDMLMEMAVKRLNVRRK